MYFFTPGHPEKACLTSISSIKENPQAALRVKLLSGIYSDLLLELELSALALLLDSEAPLVSLLSDLVARLAPDGER